MTESAKAQELIMVSFQAQKMNMIKRQGCQQFELNESLDGFCVIQFELSDKVTQKYV